MPTAQSTSHPPPSSPYSSLPLPAIQMTTEAVPATDGAKKRGGAAAIRHDRFQPNCLGSIEGDEIHSQLVVPFFSRSADTQEGLLWERGTEPTHSAIQTKQSP